MTHVLELNFLGQKESIAAFLVETIDGPVLIETGPHSTFETLKKEIKKTGHSIEDIKHVFVTHVHFDHAGAAWAMAEKGAQIYVHPLGLKHLQSPEKLYNSAKRIYGDKMEELWGEMRPIPKKQLVAMKHNQSVRIGKTRFKALDTPGHASHHIAWKVNDTLFAGDVAGVKIGNGPVCPPCPPPDINIEEWVNSIQIILNKRFETIYLTHFGKITNPREHLVELRGRLHNWANWIKPYFDAGVDQAEIVPKFEAYVKNQMLSYGADKSTIKSYDGANPVWMSVAGLMRYWYKKTEKAATKK